MKTKFQQAVVCGIASFSFIVFSSYSFADTPQVIPSDLSARFERLEAQISALQNQLAEQDQEHKEEIESLKREIEIKGPREKPVYVAPEGTAQPKWLEGLTMGGDLRLRYEAFEDNEATRDRTRFRYRLRWKVEKAVTENLDLGFRLVSGSTTDPTSTNQTFTGDFTYKDILVDQAYAKYRPAFLLEHIPFLEKVEIAGGKFENPFLQTSTGMVWDSDVTPEGFYESLEFGFLEGKLKPFVNLGQYILQENATAADAEMYGIQTGIRWNPPGFSKESEAKLTHALAYYDFSDYARDSNFLVGSTSLARGNTRLGSSPTLAAGDFDILQLYNEFKFKAGNFPVKLFADFATNLADQTPDPDGRNIGYEYGLKLGDAKKKGGWEAGYYYAYIEPNAVVGAFSDSDFGDGHADKRGSTFHVKYALTDYLSFKFTGYLVNNITGADDETRRFQTDLEWVF